MTDKSKVDDRRSSPRYLVGLLVKVIRRTSSVPEIRTGAFEGQCIDISSRGAKFETAELFYPREELELTVYSAAGDAQFRCEVEVVRSNKGSHGYINGARITQRLRIEQHQADQE